MYNKVQLIGRLGNDPEGRSAGSSNVANFNLATTYHRKDGENETEWHPVEAWGSLADNVCEYLAKGSLIFVEGRIKTEKWEDKETGEKKYKTKVVANGIKFLDKKSDQGLQNNSSRDQFNDEDIPF